MARLQDFPSVTPTSSDNLLVVQSDGQGLASVGSTLGAKMDKANPTGTGSLSINRKSGTTKGDSSVAIGSNNEASGNRSMACGDNTVSSGNTSNAFGTATIANHKAQFVFGQYNDADASTATADNRGNYVEIVGNGTSGSNRSNARTLDWSGNETLAGGLTINRTQPVGINQPIEKSSLTTSINEKASWDSAFSDLPTNFFGMVTIAFKSGYKASGLAIKTSSTYGSIFAIPNDNLNPYYYTVSGSTTTLHRLAYVS